MTEQEARAAIIRWARAHFADNDEHLTPDIEIVSIAYDEDEDAWEAELDVSTSADHPHVTFWMSAEHGLQVPTIEY